GGHPDRDYGEGILDATPTRFLAPQGLWRCRRRLRWPPTDRRPSRPLGQRCPQHPAAMDSLAEETDLPPMIKQKKKSGAVTARDTLWCRAQDLQGKGSTVPALSRTLCAGSADAAALAAASLIGAARGALPGGRSGRRDGGVRSNKGMAGEAHAPAASRTA